MTPHPLIQNRHLFLVPVLLLLTLPAFALICYCYALNGDFILDDFPNFYGLQFINSPASAINYILEGPSGLRWLAYASYLPHIEAWKAGNALPFKLVNLLIHSTNALLLLAVLYQLLPALMKARPQPVNTPPQLLLASIITVLWFAHPAHVNTVLYSVQRMTLLAGSFTLAGLLFHLKFTDKLTTTVTFRQWLGYSVALAVLTAIGVLGKESAVLLPGFAWLCLYTTRQLHLFNRWQQVITFALPYALLLTYLLAANRLGYGGRDFTMAERLLSQIVIIQHYLFKLLLPNSHSFALFYDDFQPVRSIGDLRLLIAVALWAGIGLFAWRLRTAAPVIGFGLLWFLLGHSLEGSIIPLELYFDHRNYLPSIGIITAAAVSGYQLLRNTRLSSPKLLPLLMASFVLVTINLGWHLKQETGYWQDRTSFITSQLQKRPNSLRAGQSHIELLFDQGYFLEAIKAIELLHEQYGTHVTHVLYQVLAACYLQSDHINHQAVTTDLRQLPVDMNSDDAMHSLYLAAKEQVCPAINYEIVREYLFALLSNKQHKRHFHNYAFLLTYSYLQQGNMQEALEKSMLLPTQQRSLQYWLTQIRIALAINDLKTAKQLLSEVSQASNINQFLLKHEIESMQLEFYLQKAGQ